MENKTLEQIFEKRLMHLLPHNGLKEASLYSLLPAGKLFRPNLALAIYQDLNPVQFQSEISKYDSNLMSFCLALETHHAYSLVHDDLPSMDNDDLRRGRATTHKKFGEWNAILTGDLLLNLSYQLLFSLKEISGEDLTILGKIFSHSLGGKGLIHGQYLDLSKEMNANLLNLTLTHKLKTARLIQVALLGSAILAKASDSKKLKKIARLGENIGIIFQLIDDLTELKDVNLSQHEDEINPWPKYQHSVFNLTISELKKYEDTINDLHLINTKKYLSSYFKKMSLEISTNKKQIETHIKINGLLDPIFSFLDRI